MKKVSLISTATEKEREREGKEVGLLTAAADGAVNEFGCHVEVTGNVCGGSVDHGEAHISKKAILMLASVQITRHNNNNNNNNDPQ